MIELVEGFVYGLFVASVVYLLVADHYRLTAREEREARAYYQAVAESAAWALAVERAQIKRERERARTELAEPSERAS